MSGWGARQAPRVTRVAHLRATNFFGGPEKQILAQCMCHRELRATPLIIGFQESGREPELVSKAADAGIRTVAIPDIGAGSVWTSLRSLSTALRDHGTEVLVSHGYKADICSWLMAPSRIGRLSHARGFTAENLKVRIYEAAGVHAMKHLDGVICVSRATANVVTGRGLRNREIHVVHNAVDLPKVHHTCDLRQLLGVGPDTKVVVAVGRLSPEKGPHTLLEAAELMGSTADTRVIVLIGDGFLSEDLKESIQQRNLTGRVRLLGFRRDAQELMAQADLLVNPSVSEGLPNVILEAFALGTPVVATDVGGVSEIVRDGETGRLVPPSHPQALAERIEEALSNEGKTREMVRAAGQLVRREFTFQVQLEKLQRIYDQYGPAK